MKLIFNFIVATIAVSLMTLLLFPIYALQGWVVTNLWTWFVPAALTTWIPSVWEAVGLMFLIGAIRYKAPKIDPDEDKDPIKKFKAAGKMYIFEIVGPLMFLGFGAIVKFWIL